MTDVGDDRIWYVAFGSNMDRPRLQRYLDASGDPTPPVESCAVTIPHRLFFAHESRTWTGGTAFLDPEVAGGAASFGRAWLLRRQQFCSVLAQENGATTMEVPPAVFELPPGQRLQVDRRRYGLALAIRSPDLRPALTFTTPARPLPEPTAPTRAYVETVHRGLVEAHGMTDLAAWNYLRRHGGQPLDE